MVLGIYSLMDEHSLIKSFVEAFSGKLDLAKFVDLINSVRPYGMDYSDIYHSLNARRFLGGFNDKRVLEIGGALPPQYSFEWLKCCHWTSVEYHSYDDNQGSNAEADKRSVEFREYHYTDCGWKKFYQDWRFHSSPKFDVIYSISAFEHIDNLGSCIDACYEMLAEGGILYTYFTPIWSAQNGSHGFHPPELNDLGMHSHLLFDFVSLQKILQSKGCDVFYSRNCAERLYRSPQINRYTYEEFISLFNSTAFRKKKIYPINLQLFSDLYQPEKLSIISHFYPSMMHSCNGFELVMLK